MEEQVARNSLAFYRFIIAIFLHKGQEFEGRKGYPVRIVNDYCVLVFLCYWESIN